MENYLQLCLVAAALERFGGNAPKDMNGRQQLGIVRRVLAVRIVQEIKFCLDIMIWQQKILFLLPNGILQEMGISYQLRLHQNRAKKFGGSVKKDMNGRQQ